MTVFGLGSAVAQAAASDTHTVDFTGRIYESGCQIDGDNSDKTVDLGAASAAFLKTSTNKTAEKNFNIKVVGCKHRLRCVLLRSGIHSARTRATDL